MRQKIELRILCSTDSYIRDLTGIPGEDPGTACT